MKIGWIIYLVSFVLESKIEIVDISEKRVNGIEFCKLVVDVMFKKRTFVEIMLTKSRIQMVYDTLKR